MGCITYINYNTKLAITSCEMCNDYPKKGDIFKLDGVEYLVDSVDEERTRANGHLKKSVKIYLREI